MGNKGQQQTILSIAFDKEFTYTGTNSGEVYKWSKNSLLEVIAGNYL